MALLVGYGAAVINPYLAFETIEELRAHGEVQDIDRAQAVRNYIKACTKGVLKVMSKMGISTLQSYRGAQIFEAVGLDKTFVDRCFTWTASRIGGIGIDTVAEEVVRRHARAFAERGREDDELDSGGEYQWRRDGEYHLFNPETVFKLQHASRSNQVAVYRDYARLVNDQSRQRATLRGLLDLKPAAEAAADRGGGAGRGDLQALRHWRDVVRIDQRRGARDAGDRHEPARRQVEHRRRGRGFGPVHAGRERRSAAQRRQAGGLGPLRRHQRVPRQRRRPADQDGPGRQAGRGRTTARLQGLSVDREGALLDAGRRPHFPAAAPRHLLDRGSGPAHPRPEELEPGSARAREAGRRGGRRHRRGRRLEGALGRRAHLRARRRHRGLAADEHQARRGAVGAGARRDAAGAGSERPARPDRRPGGRADEDRPRRGHRRAARRRGVRLLDGPAGGLRLHHDARLPPRPPVRSASPPRIRSCASATPARRSSSRTTSVSSPRRSAS